MRAFLLVLWGLVLLRSTFDGRLDLLLRAIFHPLVWGGGVVLLLLGVLDAVWTLRAGPGARGAGRPRLGWWLGAALAVAVLLLPPAPSFSDLASNRPGELLEEEALTFVLPPAQRSLTDWVRLLRAQPDPALYAGDPVRISGFVLPVPGDRPQLARLLVRCCLADATPVGLPVRWPAGPPPRRDRWLRVEGEMAVEPHDGQSRSVVIARRVIPIPRPARPLEP